MTNSSAVGIVVGGVVGVICIFFLLPYWYIMSFEKPIFEENLDRSMANSFKMARAERGILTPTQPRRPPRPPPMFN